MIFRYVHPTFFEKYFWYIPRVPNKYHTQVRTRYMYRMILEVPMLQSSQIIWSKRSCLLISTNIIRSLYALFLKWDDYQFSGIWFKVWYVLILMPDLFFGSYAFIILLSKEIKWMPWIPYLLLPLSIIEWMTIKCLIQKRFLIPSLTKYNN